ncbi:CPBP family intramembrane metalloprotease [Bacillus sp. EB106-08-02-XG196]|uniref:CPBP family intramembrane glutamic endopeptidase n=1 Tax=Bacillus sp. EB106-08-02-XG196 TaxID=2737049 RepID=UPI0015C4DC4E|nr:CPBP family intramembrane glutamic endopeptidase [Bacillus sp. EB106-08-02-XG196]NWQ39510.1 CPBP family intramembrane metalloprotease [Bacillus sp. EB106-08-02-XG196]
MTNNLTKPVSKRLLFALLTITIGVEIVLYLSGFSLLAGTIYDAIMVSSFFIGLKLQPRLSDGIQKTKSQVIRQFIGAFLIFILGSTMINIYSSYAFQDFSEDYEQYVDEYTEVVSYEVPEVEPGQAIEPVDNMWEVVGEIDSIGYDIFTDILAGFEEVWRLAYMILILIFFKKVFPRKWEKGQRDIFVMLALFVTSVLFGIDHTLNSVQSWQYEIGAIVTFANMGFLFGLILLWTRNLWVTVIVHSVYDILATLSWYYFDFIVEIIALILVPIYLVILAIERNQQTKKPIEPVVQEEIAN